MAPRHRQEVLRPIYDKDILSMHTSEKKQRATMHRMRSTLAAIPHSCKTVSHNILLIGLFSTLIGGVQDTWAACVPGSPTTGATVTCTGVPALPLFLNTFASAVNDLTVNVNAGATMNATLGGNVISLTGINYALTNAGVIDPAFLGPITVLSGGAFIGTGGTSTISVLNNATGIMRGTSGLLGTDLASINGVALAINNAAAGTSVITNNGTITGTPLLNIPQPIEDAPMIVIYGGSPVAFANNLNITGGIAFEASATGNTFINVGAINGSVSLGASSPNNQFTAVTGSSINIGAGIRTLPLGGLPGVTITYAPTGTVDGGTGVLVLQNTIGVGGGASGTGTANSSTYVSFSNLVINSGTWTLQGPLVSSSSTLNGGIAQFNNSATFGSGVLTSNGGILVPTSAGLNVANPITLGAGGLTVNNSNTLTLSGIISNSGDLTKSGTGQLTLSGVNTYLGATTLAGGEVVVTNAQSFSTSTVTITAPSTINALGTVTLNNPITLSANGTFGGTGSLTLAGTISGSNNISKIGTGTLSVTGNNTAYTGTTALNAGTLIVGSNTALGTRTAGKIK